MLASWFAAPLAIDNEFELVVPGRQWQRSSPPTVRLPVQGNCSGIPIIESARHEHGLRVRCVTGEFGGSRVHAHAFAVREIGRGHMCFIPPAIGSGVGAATETGVAAGIGIAAGAGAGGAKPVRLLR